MNWTHHPDSPWGDIDICVHGCTRTHRYHEDPRYLPVCIHCDYDANDNIHLSDECNCSTGSTWHKDDQCLRCTPPNEIK